MPWSILSNLPVYQISVHLIILVQSLRIVVHLIILVWDLRILVHLAKFFRLGRIRSIWVWNVIGPWPDHRLLRCHNRPRRLWIIYILGVCSNLRLRYWDVSIMRHIILSIRIRYSVWFLNERMQILLWRIIWQASLMTYYRI